MATPFASVLRRSPFRSIGDPDVLLRLESRPDRARVRPVRLVGTCINCDLPITDHFAGPDCTGRCIGCKGARERHAQKVELCGASGLRQSAGENCGEGARS